MAFQIYSSRALLLRRAGVLRSFATDRTSFRALTERFPLFSDIAANSVPLWSVSFIRGFGRVLLLIVFTDGVVQMNVGGP